MVLHNKTLTSRHHAKPNESMKLLRSGHGITALLRRKSWKIHCREVKKMRETNSEAKDLKHQAHNAFAGTYDEHESNLGLCNKSYTSETLSQTSMSCQCKAEVRHLSRVYRSSQMPVLKGCMASLNIETTKSKFHPSGESTIAEKPLAILKNVILTNPTHGTALTLLSTPL